MWVCEALCMYVYVYGYMHKCPSDTIYFFGRGVAPHTGLELAKWARLADHWSSGSACFCLPSAGVKSTYTTMLVCLFPLPVELFPQFLGAFLLLAHSRIALFPRWWNWRKWPKVPGCSYWAAEPGFKPRYHSVNLFLYLASWRWTHS